jgi:enoyl-CoA hydratase
MSENVLLVDRSEPGIAVLTLNRPAQLNALNGELVEALLTALDQIAAAGPDVKVIVLRGAGRAFCAGADLKWLNAGVLADHARLPSCRTRAGPQGRPPAHSRARRR